LFGDVNGDFRAGLDLDVGSHRLEIQGYDKDNEIVEMLTIDFDLI